MSQDEGENVLIFMFLFLTTKEKVLIEFRSSLWLFLFERRKVMLVAIKIIMMRVTTLVFVQDLKNLTVFEIFKLEFFLCSKLRMFKIRCIHKVKVYFCSIFKIMEFGHFNILYTYIEKFIYRHCHTYVYIIHITGK